MDTQSKIVFSLFVIMWTLATMVIFVTINCKGA